MSPKSSIIIALLLLLCLAVAASRIYGIVRAKQMAQGYGALCIILIDGEDPPVGICGETPDQIAQRVRQRINAKQDCPQLSSIRPGDVIRIASQQNKCSNLEFDRLNGTSRLVAGGCIDPNEDDMSTLISLPGIGPSKALAIIDYRTGNSTFLEAEDLTQVPGIGPKTASKIAPDLCWPNRH